MMFVLGLAALIRNIIDGRFSRQWGVFTTSADMIDRWKLVRIRESGGEMEIDGGGNVEYEMNDVMRRLDLDEGMVLDSIAQMNRFRFSHVCRDVDSGSYRHRSKRVLNPR